MDTRHIGPAFILGSGLLAFGAAPAAAENPGGPTGGPVNACDHAGMCRNTVTCPVKKAAEGTWGCSVSCQDGQVVLGGGFDHGAAVTEGGAFSMPEGNGWTCNVGAITACSSGKKPCGSLCYAVCGTPGTDIKTPPAKPSDRACTAQAGSLCSRVATCDLTYFEEANTWGCAATCAPDEVVTGGGFNHGAADTAGGAYNMPYGGKGWLCNVGGITACSNNGEKPCGSQCYAVCARVQAK